MDQNFIQSNQLEDRKMTKVFLPVEKISGGQPLNQIALDLNLFADVSKSSDNGHVVYSTNNQELFENVLNHSNVMLIVQEGGNITNYLMYAALPFAINGESIYNIKVPEGLQKRTIKITDGSQIIEAVKNLGQWCNADLTQTFSEDFQTIYVETRPLSAWLTGVEMKIFVDGYKAQLLTVKEYKQLNVI